MPYGPPRGPVFVVPKPPPVSVRPGAAMICSLIAGAADTHGLQRDFFARLIWKESRFDPGAISPKGAEGIAQFMPATARRRGLEKPFEPASAIAASASFLADLHKEFGNWGQAAAAYNAGEERVYRWRAGKSGLPAETPAAVVASGTLAGQRVLVASLATLPDRVQQEALSSPALFIVGRVVRHIKKL